MSTFHFIQHHMLIKLASFLSQFTLKLTVLKILSITKKIIPCIHAKTLQSCPPLCDLMDCRLASSSVHGILQARILGWIAISYFRGSSQPRGQTHVSCISCIAGRFFTTEPPVYTYSIVIRLFVFFFKGWLYCLIALNHSSGFPLYICLSVLSVCLYDIQTQHGSLGYNSLAPTCLVEFLSNLPSLQLKNLTLPGK